MTTITAEIGARRVSSPRHLALALGALAIMVVLIATLIGPQGWDDGAITLAYSRTFAETGRIALTAASEEVEGFSSALWFFINTVISLFRPGFEGAILASQVVSGLCLGLVIVLVQLIAREMRLRADTALAIMLVLALCGPSASEVADGMEMTLLAASGLALVHALYFRPNRLVLAVAIVVFLTTRFEAMIYYAVMLVPLLFRRRLWDFLLLGALGLAVVGAQEAARYAVFGDVLPNTILAKMHFPYSHSGLAAVRTRIAAAAEIPVAFLPIFMALLALVVRERRRLATRLSSLAATRGRVIVLIAPYVGVVTFAILAGKNWGYIGRMQFLAIPFVLLLAGILFERLSYFRDEPLVRATLVSVSVATIIFSWVASAPNPLAHVGRVLSAGPARAGEHFGITPASYRETGLAVDRVRHLLGIDPIAFLTPDVGGLGLCCSRIRVVDIGLLSNRRLAREGLAAVPSVLESERPDLIESHGEWSEASDLYSLSEFQANYQPIMVGRTRFFIRNDDARKLIEAHDAKWCRVEDAECLPMALENHRYVEYVFRADDVAFLARGKFLILG